MSFESAGKRVGSLNVNLIRLVISLLFFFAYQLVRFGRPLPLDAPPSVWLYLSLSGLIGFVIGDLFLFQAFVVVGARIAMLIYSLVPILTTLIAWFVLGELPSILQFVGMLVTVTGIGVVVLTRQANAGFRTRHPIRGIAFALAASVAQAAGLVLGRYGAPAYNAVGATQIRALAGTAGFMLIISVARGWRPTFRALSDGRAMALTSNGAFFGPFVGVSLGLFAAQNTKTGIAATIIALVPVLILPWSRWVLKEKVGIRDAAGAVLACAGVALLFLVP